MDVAFSPVNFSGEVGKYESRNLLEKRDGGLVRV